MGNYVVIETRDPFEHADVTYDLATSLAQSGSGVTVFLAQNGVLPVRRTSSMAGTIAELAGQVSLWADDFSLRERGIGQDELVPGVTPASMESLVELVAQADSKVIWH
jgi:sulfur relay protein TusB/DsrH